MARRFKWNEFAQDVRTMREHMGMGLREAARCLKIGKSTWCRAEQGKPIETPDFIFFCDWMDIDPKHYLSKRASA